MKSLILVCSLWLEKDFMQYLHEWEKSIRERPGFKDLKNEQNIHLETRQGIEITGM